MSFSTIDKSSDYFRIKTYTGNGATRSITFDETKSMSPDLLWIKCRSDAVSHLWFDAVRGVSKRLISNSTNAESTETTISSFDANGWTMDADTANNGSGRTYVAWAFDANGTGVSNTQGSITSTVSANTTAGFSIVSWTGAGSAGTVGHGLGAVPKFIITKKRNNVGNWACYHSSLGNTQYIYLNSTNASATYSGFWNNTTPTSTLISLGTDDNVTGNGDNIIAYCFAEVKGYSKFGSYTGNGSTDGTFVYTGFKPAMIIAKQSSGGQSWQIHDTARDTFNLATRVLFPNSSSAEQNSSANGALDILSNGFKWRMADADQNGSGSTYIYMAFASNPFVSSKGIAVTAR